MTLLGDLFFALFEGDCRHVRLGLLNEFTNPSSVLSIRSFSCPLFIPKFQFSPIDMRPFNQGNMCHSSKFEWKRKSRSHAGKKTCISLLTSSSHLRMTINQRFCWKSLFLRSGFDVFLAGRPVYPGPLMDWTQRVEHQTRREQHDNLSADETKMFKVMGAEIFVPPRVSCLSKIWIKVDLKTFLVSLSLIELAKPPQSP